MAIEPDEVADMRLRIDALEHKVMLLAQIAEDLGEIIKEIRRAVVGDS